MQHGSELNEALQRQAQQQSGSGEGLSQGAPSQPSGGTPSSALQQQQPAPLQHFMMAEQVQAISVSPSQQNPHSNLLGELPFYSFACSSLLVSGLDIKAWELFKI